MIRCECGLFDADQFDPDLTGMPIPLSYHGVGDEVESSECDKPSGGINDCMQYCQQYYDGEGGNTIDLCQNTTGVVSIHLCCNPIIHLIKTVDFVV